MTVATHTTRETEPAGEPGGLRAQPGAGLARRWRVAGIRTRILVPFIGMLVLATVASVFLARAALHARLDDRIDQELAQEASELRQLASGVDPETGEPFADDVRRVFRVYFERNIPSPWEALLTFVDGRPFLRSRDVAPYRLDRDRELVGRWATLTRPERSSVDTPAGQVEYLAVPLEHGGNVLGVFVVAVFRDLEREPFDEAFLAVGVVALAVLLIGSLLAWRVAESVLRPVRSVTTAARSITETDLSRRIAVEGNDEVADLAATFNAMVARLEAAFAAQRRFLDDAGHELKTPLTIVQGHLELLEEDPAEREATLELVRDELERMARLVNDLLLLAKAEAPDFLRLETVDVEELTHELHAKVQPLGVRRWELDSVGRGVIVADRQRLTQALTQLVENAVKHTGEDDAIRLGSSVDHDSVHFSVADTGVGLPAGAEQRIFERFARGGNGSRDGGLGLGLAIVRAIAEAHGGWVDVRSEPGAGTTFTVAVPLGAGGGRSA